MSDTEPEAKPKKPIPATVIATATEANTEPATPAGFLLPKAGGTYLVNPDGSHTLQPEPGAPVVTDSPTQIEG